MTKNPSVYIDPLIAEAPSWFSTYYDKILGGLWAVAMSAFAVWATWFKEGRAKREDREQQRRDQNELGNSNVMIENIRAMSKDREQKAQEVSELRAEWARFQEATNRREEIHEQRMQALSIAYCQVYGMLTIKAQTERTLKARLKLADTTFDPAEFPEQDLSEYSPNRVLSPLSQPISVTVVSSPTDPKKMTSVIKQGGA